MKRLSEDEFQQEIKQMREMYLEHHEKTDLDANVDVKVSFFDRFRTLDGQRERLRRQLSELEIKRCRAALDKKSAEKIDQKLAIKKALFKKIMDDK